METIESKYVLITGATSGIGQQAAEQLAGKGFEIGLLGRSEEKLNATASGIKSTHPDCSVETFVADLGEPKSILDCVEHINNKRKKIDILINNAGIIMGKERKLNSVSVEYTLAVNHLGHFLLTNKLLSLLQVADSAKIINIASEAHRFYENKFDVWSLEGIYSGIKAYGISKYYNILHAKKLANQYPDIQTFSVHPGGVATNFASHEKSIFNSIFRFLRPFLRKPAKGAETMVYLASEDTISIPNGSYLADKKVKKPVADAENPDYADILWKESEQIYKEYLK